MLSLSRPQVHSCAASAACVPSKLNAARLHRTTHLISRADIRSGVFSAHCPTVRFTPVAAAAAQPQKGHAGQSLELDCASPNAALSFNIKGLEDLTAAVKELAAKDDQQGASKTDSLVRQVPKLQEQVSELQNQLAALVLHQRMLLDGNRAWTLGPYSASIWLPFKANSTVTYLTHSRVKGFKVDVRPHSQKATGTTVCWALSCACGRMTQCCKHLHNCPCPLLFARAAA